jgi:MFS transporter, DHA1 family, inner membrane transport protein
MSFFTNPNINRLAVHTTLHELANSLSGLFSAVYLLRIGLSPAAIFLIFATIYGLRFALRPMAFVIVPILGLRWTMVLGTILIAGQYQLLGLVDEVGLELALFCAAAAAGQVLYWTCYHTFFSTLGDAQHRGSQVGVRQVFIAMAGIAGPAVGGVMLAAFGPLAAFGAAAVAETAAALPLIRLAELPLARIAPTRAYASAKTSILLFATDGWITSGSLWAWHIVMFQAVDERYEMFGGILAVATLAGAIGGMLLGRMIDLGHMRRVAWLNAGLLVIGLLARSLCGLQADIVIVVAILSTLIGGLYVPVLMTTIYNQAKQAPCPFRFQFAIEGGWDVGAFLLCLVAAGIYASGGSSQAVILLAIPMVALQMRLLDRLNKQDSHETRLEIGSERRPSQIETLLQKRQ